MHEHGDMTGACSMMTLMQGDRYSQISVYSSSDKVNKIEVETDLGASLSIGVSRDSTEESFVLFSRS